LNGRLRYARVTLSAVLCCLIFVLTFIYFYAQPAKTSAASATYTVTKTADTLDGTCDADCSFREAVVAANANAGFDEIDFNIPTSDGGYTAPSGSTQGYFTLSSVNQITLTDDSGAFINGYSQAGSSRNTAAFGSTVNAVLKIRISLTFAGVSLNITGNNNHLAGLNMVSTSVGPLQMNTSSHNWIEGNLFGTDITGISFSNWAAISTLTNSSFNTIGTNGDGNADEGERNVIAISSSGSNGAYSNNDSGSSNQIIAGNYMGVNATGRTCSTGTINRHIILLSAGDAVRIGSNFDGTSDSEESNIIACTNGMTRAGIRYNGTNGIIQGNYIGTNPQGDDLKSSFDQPGLRSEGNAVNWLIKRNVIAYNGSRGLGVTGSGDTGVRVSQNTIYNNVGLGLDLNVDGVTPNDPGDVDTGANDLMNYPVITKAGISNDNRLIIQADLDFKASEGPFTLEFFDNDAIDSSNYGEGQYYLGSVTTSAIGSGVILSIPLNGRIPTSVSRITATATNASGSTSEFSRIPANAASYSTLAAGGVSINDGAGSTATRYVLLNLGASAEFTAVTDVKIANDPDFSGRSYERFTPIKDWTLTEGNGVKTVYVKFKDESGNESPTYADAIELNVPIVPTPSPSYPTVTKKQLSQLTIASIAFKTFGLPRALFTYVKSRNPRPTFAGITTKNYTVTVLDGDTVLCRAKANAKGAWICRSSVLKFNNYAPILQLSDTNGTIVGRTSFRLFVRKPADQR
jgi:CSLREA domain-containing protein